MPASSPLHANDIEAARIVADSNYAIAEAINGAAETLKPAVGIVVDAAHRLDLLCTFMRKRGPLIIVSIPSVLVTANAITPEAAKAVHRLLVAFGVGL